MQKRKNSKTHKDEGALPAIKDLGQKKIMLRKSKFLDAIDFALQMDNIQELRTNIKKLKEEILAGESELIVHRDKDIEESRDVLQLSMKYVIEELTQIEESLTIGRAKYYLNRLKKALTVEKRGKINDINLNRWKEYDEVITDSLWIFDRRDSSGAHLAWYWGNFIPQIPHQLMLRYTKKGDWVLDPFLGSGTTLIECRRLGRNGIGVEINEDVARKAKELIDKEPNNFGISTEVIVGDSTKLDFTKILEERKIEKVQLIIMHPPYHDIIKFTSSPGDLSNAPTVDEFVRMFGQVLDNVAPVLEPGRYLGIVIGDKYMKSEWVPLGFYLMNEVMARGNFILKSIVVKNFEETRAKRAQKELWRYRALVGGFYVFKHEYILIFQKKSK